MLASIIVAPVVLMPINKLIPPECKILHIFFAHLSQRLKVSYCYLSSSVMQSNGSLWSPIHSYDLYNFGLVGGPLAQNLFCILAQLVSKTVILAVVML